MTDNEIKKAFEYWEEFDEEIDALIRRHPSQEEELLEQRRVVRITRDALKALENYEETRGAKKVRADAIRKFAERVNDIIYDADDVNPVSEWQIGNLVKEMTGADDEQKQTNI